MSTIYPGENRVVGKANLLISARSIEESRIVIDSGAAWLDVKEPLRGSLGRPDLELIEELSQLEIPATVQVSIAGGELVEWTLDLDQSLAAKLPDRFYLKLALSHCQGTHWAESIQRISQRLGRPDQLILVHYADAEDAQSPEWDEVVDVAMELGGRYVLVDTFDKQTGGLLDHCSADRLRIMIDTAAERGLGVALAGSIQLNQLESLAKLGAQWLGMRGAVCRGTLRTDVLCSERLKQALSSISKYTTIEP